MMVAIGHQEAVSLERVSCSELTELMILNNWAGVLYVLGRNLWLQVWKTQQEKLKQRGAYCSHVTVSPETDTH